MKVLLPQGEGITLDLVTKKALSKEKRQEGESRNTPAPNGMISGGKKERVARHSQMQAATQTLQLLFSLTPSYKRDNGRIFKSYLATRGKGACVDLEEVCSKEQNSC